MAKTSKVRSVAKTEAEQELARLVLEGEIQSMEQLESHALLSEIEQERVNRSCGTPAYGEIELKELGEERNIRPESFLLSASKVKAVKLDRIRLTGQENGRFFNLIKNRSKYINFYCKEGLIVTWKAGLNWLNHDSFHFNDMQIQVFAKDKIVQIESKGRLVCLIETVGNNKLSSFTTDKSLAWQPDDIDADSLDEWMPAQTTEF